MFYLGFLFFVISPNVQANTIELDSMAVTPTALPTFTNSQNISHEILTTTGAPDIVVPLSMQPGLNIAQTKSGMGTGISLNGASGSLGLISFDGIPLFGNFSGYYSLRNYPNNVVGDVDIIYPPNVDTGSRNLGGHIALDSRQIDNNEGEFGYETGSQAWHSIHVNKGISFYNTPITFASGYRRVYDGASQTPIEMGGIEQDNNHLGYGLLRVDRTINHVPINASLYHVKVREDTDGPAFGNNHTVIWGDDPNGWFINETTIAQVSADFKSRDNWSSQIQIGGTVDKQDGALGVLGPFSMHLDSSLWLARWDNKHSLFFDSIEDRDLSFLWSIGAQNQHAKTQVGNRKIDESLYSTMMGVEWSEPLWGVHLWLRHEKTQDEDKNLPGIEFSIIDDSNRYWLGWNQAFRAVAVNERLHPLFGNLDLKSEQSSGWNAGWEWNKSANTQITIRSYFQNYKNLITMQYNAETGTNRAANIANSQVFGFDMIWNQIWIPQWNTQFAYGQMLTRDNVNDKELASRPKHKLSINNNWQISPLWDIGVSVNMHDKFWFDSAHRLQADSLIRIDAQLTYQLYQGTKIFIRGENLSDDDAREIYGFGYPERAFYIGITTKM